MPRILSSNGRIFDFDRQCYPRTLQDAQQVYGRLGNSQDGEDGGEDCFDYNAHHPPFNNGEEFKCCVCKKVLTKKDN